MAVENSSLDELTVFDGLGDHATAIQWFRSIKALNGLRSDYITSGAHIITFSYIMQKK